MDFINPLITQLRDLMASMTPGARLTAGLLLVVVVVSLGFLFQSTTAGPDEFLFGGEPLGMTQINRMEAALGEAGLADFVVESNRIRVPRGLKDKYIAAIASAGALPPDFASLMDDALAKASPLESRQQWLARTKSAREQQLAHIIGLMDWVEYATVMYEIEEGIGLRRNDRAAASVFVLPAAGEALTGVRRRSLQQLVAGWHPSLSAEDVNITSGGDTADGGDGEAVFDDPYMIARDAFERDKRADILHELGFIPGVRVQVNADLDTLLERTVVDTQPGTPAAVSEVAEAEKTESATSDGGGRPGLEAQGPGRTGTDASLARENRSTTTRDNTKTENVVGSVAETATYRGYKVKEAFASVAIPRDYVISIWRQRTPDSADKTPTDNDLRTIQTEVQTTVENLVQPLLPKLTLGEDEYTQVNVAIIDSITPEAPAPPSMGSQALGWASQYWPTLSMLGLAGFSLLMMRSVLAGGRGGSPSPASPAIEVTGAAAAHAGGGGHAGDAGGAADADDPSRPRLKLRKAESLKDDLAEMVREDPDAAAAILRTWIGKAA